MLCRNTGVIGYIREYWSGFFPLLLVEMAHKNGETDIIDNKCAIAVHSLFSVTHRIIIDNESSTEFIFESVARFYNHIKVFMCQKFQQTLHTHRLGHLVSLSLTERFWICSGMCSMRVSQKKEDRRTVGGQPRTGFLRQVRKTIVLRSKVQSDDQEKSSVNDEIE